MIMLNADIQNLWIYYLSFHFYLKLLGICVLELNGSFYALLLTIYFYFFIGKSKITNWIMYLKETLASKHFQKNYNSYTLKTKTQKKNKFRSSSVMVLKMFFFWNQKCALFENMFFFGDQIMIISSKSNIFDTFLFNNIVAFVKSSHSKQYFYLNFCVESRV
jgi:hypothetical protein